MKRIFIFSLMMLVAFLAIKAQNTTTGDIGWPRQVSNSSAQLVYYQPQIDKWDNYKKLTGRIAFAMTPTNGKQVLGVASFVCDTKTDKEAHTTYLHNIDYTDIRFPSLNESAAASSKATFLALMPKYEETIATDRLLADMDRTQVNVQGVQVKNDPPTIFYSAGSSILLIVEGTPVLAPIDGTDLQFVVNTNWDLFFEKSTNQYFLLVNNIWLVSQDLKGHWKQTKAIPKDMVKLPSGQNFDDVKKVVPAPATTGAVPQVFFNDKPAELIVTKGAPVYTKIPGTQLVYVSNTDNDLFLDNTDKHYYILLSGRWFKSDALGGPWTYAGNTLPVDFAKIPKTSPKAHVLASVPGTVEASDAVMLAQIPTTVVVNKAEAEAGVKVTYIGDPQFKTIDGTSMQYATNTQDKVIKTGSMYYLCYQGVWFVSNSATEGWKVATTIPAEIYTIPVSSPVYNVTYVTQVNTSETTVEASSTSGYMGAFIVGTMIDVALVYGTGFYYSPFYYWGPLYPYPIYYPWPWTYGAGVVYNPWTGGWAAGRAVYGPYGAARTAAWYNPATGRYGRAASIQGWYGGRTAANFYNPWTGTYGHTSQAHNPYAQWGHSAVTNGKDWARTGHVTTANGTIFGYQTSGGKEGIVTHGDNGTVVRTQNGTYVGHDGNVYRKNSDGNWSKYNSNGKWSRVDSNTGEHQTQHQPAQNIGGNGGTQHKTMEYLDRSAQSRQRGQIQTQRFQNNFNRTRGVQQLGGGFNRR